MSIFRAIRAAHAEIDAMLEQATDLNLTRFLVLGAIGHNPGASRNLIIAETCIARAGVCEALTWLLREDMVYIHNERTSRHNSYSLTETGKYAWAHARHGAIAVDQALVRRLGASAVMGSIVEALNLMSKNEEEAAKTSRIVDFKKGIRS